MSKGNDQKGNDQEEDPIEQLMHSPKIATFSEKDFHANMELATTAEAAKYSTASIGNFASLPKDSLWKILSYVEFKEMGAVKNINRTFYTYTTGYKSLGQVVSKHISDMALSHPNLTSHPYLNTRILNCPNKKNLIPDNISSLYFTIL